MTRPSTERPLASMTASSPRERRETPSTSPRDRVHQPTEPTAIGIENLNLWYGSKQALTEGSHLVFIGDPKHREVIGYTHDLDPSTYHIVSKIEEAESIDWSSYTKIMIFYQTTLNADDFEDVVRVIESRPLSRTKTWRGFL